MKILKNFKVLREGGLEEYPAVEIRMKDSEVFIDLPLCTIDFNEELVHPVLIGYNQAGIAQVIEKAELYRKLQQTQKVYFELNSDRDLVMVDKVTELYTRLPITDDPHQYLYEFRDGSIYVIQKEIPSKEVEE